LSDIGLIVVDELHMLSEYGRGAILESLLSKVLYLNKTVQIVGMSATLPNIADISSWLKGNTGIQIGILTILLATVYSLDWRPVELSEYLNVNNCILNSKGELIRNLYNSKTDDVIAELIIEVIQLGKSVLVFCPSKDDCQQRAKKVAQLFNQHFRDIQDTKVFHSLFNHKLIKSRGENEKY
jgi:replicative superfamily II helicase